MLDVRASTIDFVGGRLGMSVVRLIEGFDDGDRSCRTRRFRKRTIGDDFQIRVDQASLRDGSVAGGVIVDQVTKKCDRMSPNDGSKLLLIIHDGLQTLQKVLLVH